MNRPAILTAILLAAVMTGTAAADEPQPVASHPMFGKAAPDFDLGTIAGDSLGLADLEGDYVVIHFGASW